MASIENKLEQASSVPLTKKIDSKTKENINKSTIIIKNYKNVDKNKKPSKFIINKVLLSSQPLINDSKPTTTTTNKPLCAIQRIKKQLLKLLNMLRPLICRQVWLHFFYLLNNNKLINFFKHFYAHCTKLAVLFMTIIIHLYYIEPFLRTVSALEEYSNLIDLRIKQLNKLNNITESPIPNTNNHLLHNEVEVFINVCTISLNFYKIIRFNIKYFVLV